MSYEVDFIGVGSEVKQNADAICFRWLDGADYYGRPIYKVCVFDGGFEAHGKKMVEHMNQYYFNSSSYREKVIDFVFVSHPDQDHTIGIKTILENFTVRSLYMNRPWLYADELFDKVNDGRMTRESLCRKLRNSYKTIADIEDIALKKGIPIYEAFQGEEIEGKLLIVSPSKQFYLDLLVESEKTPLQVVEGKSFLSMSFSDVVKSVKNYVYSLLETWNEELLREEVETSAENETSVVLRGVIEFNGFLLVGDAGVRALNKAMDYLDSIGEDIKESVELYQIPHHGSRHNINPSTLDRMFGGKVKEGEITGKIAIASVAKDSKYPLRIVTNAYLCRGVRPFKTDENITCLSRGNMPMRNWGHSEMIEFSRVVEEYNENS